MGTELLARFDLHLFLLGATARMSPTRSLDPIRYICVFVCLICVMEGSRGRATKFAIDGTRPA